MLPYIWATENPSYVRINTKPSTMTHKPYEFGKAELIFEGADFTILTYGYMLENCIKAHQLLSDLGYKVGLVNMRNLKPFDGELIQSILPKTGRFITVEDHFLTGGLFTILAEFLVGNNLHIPVNAIAFEEKWFSPGTLHDVLANEGLSPEKLVERIEKFIQNA
jgi:transketolase